MKFWNPHFPPALLLAVIPLGNKAIAEPPGVRPFLDAYCIACHGPDKAKGKIRLDGLSLPISSEKDAALWHRVLESIQFGEMPSDKAKKFPTRAEARQVEGWIQSALLAHGRKLEDKSSAEGYGNLVSHELLFTPQERGRKIDVAARLWRISPETLVATLRSAGGAHSPTNPFKFDKPHGNFTDFKGKYLLNSVMTEELAELALKAAESKTGDKFEPTVKSAMSRGASRPEAMKALVARQFQHVLRRTPSENELVKLTALMERVDSDLGEPYGLRAAYAAIILTPETIFRFEGTQDASTEGGLVQLSNRELAFALAYALTDRPPDNGLLAAFQEPSKPVQETLRLQAQKLLANNRYAKPRLLQFFQEFFDYQKAADIFKDKEPGHYHWAPALVNDLDELIRHALEKDRQVLKTLLTTSEYFVLVNSWRDNHNPLAYNLPHDFKLTRKPVALPKDQRMGVLTHPAWLVAHSGNFDNDPIHRGMWIRKKLLGGMVPDVPITVDAKLPDEPTWTLRERMHVTEVDECYKCHSKMNPLGLPFEKFDHFGRFRLDEQQKPVVTTGAVFNSGVPALDGDVKDPFELIGKLANSTHVEQVFVRHVFRFFLGRNETLGDAKTLQDAHKAYVDSNGSFQALVVSLLSSDSFIYRKAVSDTQAGD